MDPLDQPFPAEHDQHAPSSRADAPQVAPGVVRQALAFVPGDRTTGEVLGELAYDAVDPWAVTLRLRSASGAVTWLLARELLDDGCHEPVGLGDVRIWPCLSDAGEAVVIVELSSPQGHAVLQTPTRGVRRFVDATYTVVPRHHESRHLPLPATLARLLG